MSIIKLNISSIFNQRKCDFFFQSTEICIYENKAIHSIWRFLQIFVDIFRSVEDMFNPFEDIFNWIESIRIWARNDGLNLKHISISIYKHNNHIKTAQLYIKTSNKSVYNILWHKTSKHLAIWYLWTRDHQKEDGSCVRPFYSLIHIFPKSLHPD